MNATLATATVSTPIGDLALFARDEALVGLAFADGVPRLRPTLLARFGDFRSLEARDPAGAVDRLRAYLGGELGAVDDIPVDVGGTPFQAAVWAALRAIPVGTTCSYGDLARAVGRPGAMRAVGAANGANPVSVVVPCHRVIASNGKLHGYGGGLGRKRWLLTHERALLL